MKQFIAVSALLAVAACSTPPPPPTLYCPQVAVLQQASALTQFLPGRQDISAQLIQAKVTGVAGSCTLEKKKNLLLVKFQAGFSATNGPANTSAQINLPYFISLSTGNTIISKAIYGIPLSFEGNLSTASAATKPIKVEFPNTPDSAATEILVGFQLTPDELAYAGTHPAGP